MNIACFSLLSVRVASKGVRSLKKCMLPYHAFEFLWVNRYQLLGQNLPFLTVRGKQLILDKKPPGKICAHQFFIDFLIIVKHVAKDIIILLRH